MVPRYGSDEPRAKDWKTNLPDGSPPTISIVTPSRNQAKYLEEAMTSVLTQGYRNLEYIVIDGGSTDGSVEIIRKFADRLAYWVSAPDEGQYAAIQEGFRRSTGEIMAWLNSSDKYAPWALGVVGEVFRQCPEVEWLTTGCPLAWREDGLPVGCRSFLGFDARSFFRGRHLPMHGWFGLTRMQCIQQESTFWRRSLWERAGARMDTSLRYAGDFELWARLFQEAELCSIRVPLGGFRVHREQKTSGLEAYIEEAEGVLRRWHGRRYGSVASTVRCLTSICMSGEVFPSRRLPRRLLAPLVASGIVYRGRTCRWNGCRWETESAYFV